MGPGALLSDSEIYLVDFHRTAASAFPGAEEGPLGRGGPRRTAGSPPLLRIRRPGRVDRSNLYASMPPVEESSPAAGVCSCTFPALRSLTRCSLCQIGGRRELRPLYELPRAARFPEWYNGAFTSPLATTQTQKSPAVAFSAVTSGSEHRWQRVRRTTFVESRSWCAHTGHCHSQSPGSTCPWMFVRAGCVLLRRMMYESRATGSFAHKSTRFAGSHCQGGGRESGSSSSSGSTPCRA